MVIRGTKVCRRRGSARAPVARRWRRTSPSQPGSSPSDALRPRLQRQIHRLEAAAGVAVEASGEQGHQEPGEDLALDESRPTSTERLDREDVFAVEEAGHE